MALGRKMNREAGNIPLRPGLSDQSWLVVEPDGARIAVNRPYVVQERVTWPRGFEAWNVFEKA
jgi:hypothetical protein